MTSKSDHRPREAEGCTEVTTAERIALTYFLSFKNLIESDHVIRRGIQHLCMVKQH
jgi:hypothetical protein